MVRSFNTAGPCLPALHYMVPPLRRLPQARGLVEQMGYFVLHAPRQTGKTTTLMALARELTATGQYAALRFSCEGPAAAGEDSAAVQRAILRRIRSAAAKELPADLRPPQPPWPEPEATDTELLGEALAAWAQRCPRPLVLFFDEIDAIGGQSLLSVLRQLRDGFSYRPAGFPASVVLCGLRDVRDYKAASGSGNPSRLSTSSPFNVKVESLLMGSFTLEEVWELYGQHTADTGQKFTDEAVQRAFDLTQGQPWLVNALARETLYAYGMGISGTVTAEHAEEAKERLILARATHFDSLYAKLTEERVRKVLEPVIAGSLVRLSPYGDDLVFTRDLGLVAPTDPVRIANPIYHEVILRVLASGVEANVLAEPRSFVLPDGRLDLDRILREFGELWLEHGDLLTGWMPYQQPAPQLVLMGFLHRVVNGGGHVHREYGVGRGRIDLLIRWPYPAPAGDTARRLWQREAIELKTWNDGQTDPLSDGLTQLDGYLDLLGLDRGVLMIFDRRSNAAGVAARTRFEEATSPKGRPVTVLRA